MRPRFLLALLFCLIFLCFSSPCYCSPGVAELLCERGIYYYENEDYANALREFKKALLVEPDNPTAFEYIIVIEKEVLPKEAALAELIEEERPVDEEGRKRKRAIIQALDEAEEPKTVPRPRVTQIVPPPEEVIVTEKRPTGPVILNDQVKATQPDTLLELEIEKPLVIQGNHIRRFLVIEPEIVAVEREGADQIRLIALKSGVGFLHVWDQQGRWSFKFQSRPARPEGPTLEEIRRKEIRQTENFKLRYATNRDAYFSGTDLSDLERQTLAINHWLSMDGETPYGRFDSSARVAKHEEHHDLTYLTLGLTKAEIGPLKDFDLRGFDYTMYGSELGFPGISLRGVRFDQRLGADGGDYTLFWGREGQGTFGRLSPGLEEAKDSFIEGGRFFFRPSEMFNCQLAYYHGYGSERDGSLNQDGMDIIANLDLNNWHFSAEGGYDSARFAYTLDSVFMVPGLKFRSEYRNIFPGYVTIIGRPSRLGEMGGLCWLEFNKIDKLSLIQRADIYQDRLNPNPQRPDMWNIELDTRARYSLTDSTALDLSLRYWDEKGKISPRREESLRAGIRQSIDLIRSRDLSIYSNYQYQKTKNFSSATNDYETHRAKLGARLRLLGGLSTFASQEYNWLNEAEADETSHPRAWEAGIDYNRRLKSLPLYTSLRASYRREEDTSGTYSFMAGEDSLEIQSELRYRPFGDWELFASGRVRKVWPNDDVEEDEYAEGEFLTGLRFLFDTGLTWNPVGDIYGVVFKDIDGNGLQGEDEPGIEGVEVYLGQEESAFSDVDGEFAFLNVRAKQAYLNLGLSSIPSGFVPSTSTDQAVSIDHGEASAVSFGLSFRCEIVGSVFIDANGNGRFDADEAGQGNVLLRLEDGSEARTNDRGQFYFRKASVGTHTLHIDVNTIPIHLLPKVPIKKEMFLTEGTSYVYNIPLEVLR